MGALERDLGAEALEGGKKGEGREGVGSPHTQVPLPVLGPWGGIHRIPMSRIICIPGYNAPLIKTENE